MRFLRAGLVTPLPGGPGIESIGITTGLRGASLDWDSGRRVTPARCTSQETRPGLSHGINLRGKRRSGAPRGERTDRKVRCRASQHGFYITAPSRRSTPSFREALRIFLGKARARIAPRERARSSAPAAAGQDEA
jgi:hypothetical protein